ncbi:efflux RND transporter permease subunit [Alloprevotella rava]|uniref:HAE1 family hydrophobic/amphiphilic exporter-1 n=1 Tax=Alloprevotella rava TaxID=671218 RepID=A0A7W5UXX3_9BACT|nr:efflux RND transporter permease subunit [Alloprevotella rava]MBB3703594.1 HAE1 family hydrophobic/amphiphilic exporter-1 [Alloprevotella rava]
MSLDRFINRPVLSTVISIFIVIFGIISITSLPITQYPEIAPPTVSVSTSYTGANAQSVLNSVIMPLEEQINGVENMDYMTSTATNTGQANISITFKQGTDADMAAINVQNRVSMAQGLLPAEVTRVGVITQKRQSSMLVVFSLVDMEDKYSQEFLDNYAKINVVPQIQRIKGVGEAMVMGADYSMRIWLDPAKMAEYHLMPSDVTAALATQNIEAAPGTLGERENQTYQYTLTWKGRLSTETEFGDIVIKALPDGEVLRLKDVAKIELGSSSYSFGGKVNGHKSVTCIVFQLSGTNATETVSNITKFLDTQSASLPSGMQFVQAQNVNDFLFASVEEVIKTLLEAFILVFLVVYIFLQDMRSTLIPAIAIPVSLIGAFFGMNLLGFSINLLTLNALVLAIAIVVDDAIIVVEGVHSKLDQGYSSTKKASIDAMRELGGALVSITLIMMAVFIPVSFISGTSGTFYRQFGLTMAISIFFSALNALTLSPALCAIFLKAHDKDGKEKKMSFIDKFHTAFNTSYDRILGKYKNSVVKICRHPIIAISAVIIGIAGLTFLMKVTPDDMIPSEDTGTIMGSISLPPGTSQDRTDKILAQVDSIVAACPAVQSHTLISGYGMTGGQGASYGSIIIKLKPWSERSMRENSQILAIQFLLRSRDVIKDAKVLFFQPPMIMGYGTTNGFTFSLQDRTGDDLNKFFKVTQDFIAKLQERPEIQQAQTTFSPNFPQYLIDIDPAQCLKAGLTPSDILTTLQGYIGGLYSSNFNRFGKLYRVMIQAEGDKRINTESLKNIMVRNGSVMAPITQFMSIKRVYGPDNINRFNMYTSISVNGSPASGYTSGQAMKAIEETAAQNLPAGYSYEYSGMTREQNSQSNTTIYVFILCLLFIYLLLAAQYESYILPWAVLLSVPFGLAGSFLFLWIMGGINQILPIFDNASNNIYVQIALIMLMGLLAKNAILIVEFAIERRKMGMSITWAAVLGAGARLRPILMTSLAMIVGLLPLMFNFGVGAHGNRSLGTTAVGGMLVGVICQIFFVPSLFVIFQSIQERFKPMVWEDIDNSDAEADIEQYTKK